MMLLPYLYMYLTISTAVFLLMLLCSKDQYENRHLIFSISIFWPLYFTKWLHIIVRNLLVFTFKELKK